MSFRDLSLEVPESVLEVWLKLMVDEIDRVAAPPSWLTEAREDWSVAAIGGFGAGIMVPELDDVVTDEARRQTVLDLSLRTLERIRGFGDPIPAAKLNALGAGPPDGSFQRDVGAEVFVAPVQQLATMLREARLG